MMRKTERGEKLGSLVRVERQRQRQRQRVSVDMPASLSPQFERSVAQRGSLKLLQAGVRVHRCRLQVLVAHR